MAPFPFAAFAQNVAIVNGKPVPKARMDVLAQQLAAAGRPVTPEMQGQLREEVIAREVFMQEAQKQGLDATDDYKTQLELARQAILIRQLFDNYRKTNPVTDADVQAEYDKFVAANSGKEYKARHILVETEDRGQEDPRRPQEGRQVRGHRQEAEQGPGLGRQRRRPGLGQRRRASCPSSREAMVKLKKGETTPAPVKSQFGYHIIRVDDIRQAQLPKLEEVKPQIMQQLQQQTPAEVPGRTARQGQGRITGSPPGWLTSCSRPPPHRGQHQRPGGAGSAVFLNKKRPWAAFSLD